MLLNIKTKIIAKQKFKKFAKTKHSLFILNFLFLLVLYNF